MEDSGTDTMTDAPDAAAPAFTLDPYESHKLTVNELYWESTQDRPSAEPGPTKLTTTPLLTNHVKEQSTMVKALAESMRMQWGSAPKDMKHWTCSIFRGMHCLPKEQEANDEFGTDLEQNVFELYNDTGVTLLVFLELMANEQYYRKLLHQTAVKAQDLTDHDAILKKCKHLFPTTNAMEVELAAGDDTEDAMETDADTAAVTADVLTFKSEMDHTLQYNILDCAEQKPFSGNEEDHGTQQETIVSCHLVKHNKVWVDRNDAQYQTLRNVLRIDEFAQDGFNSKYHIDELVKDGTTKVRPFWFPWKPYCMQAAWGVSMAFGINHEVKTKGFVNTKCSYFHKMVKPDTNHANRSHFTQYTELSYIHAIAMCNLLRVPCTIYKLSSQNSLEIRCSNDLSRPVEYEAGTPTPRGVFGIEKTVLFTKEHKWVVKQKAATGNRVPHVRLLEVDLLGRHVETNVPNMNKTDLRRPRKIFIPLQEQP